MKCKSCTADIPPAFKAAVKSNICPGCGEALMTTEDQELFSEIKTAMEKMPNDPEGLAGWLLSTFHLQKIGEIAPTEFYNKRGHAPIQDSGLPPGFKIPHNPTQEFLKRTGHANAIQETQAKNYRQLVEHIQSNADNYTQPPLEEGEESDEEEAEENGYDAAERQALANRRNFKSVAKALAAQAQPLLIGDPKPLLPSEEYDMKASIEQALTPEEHPILQNARIEKLRNAGAGSFRRAN